MPAQEDTAHRIQITLGILLDGVSQERWVLEALRQALSVPGVRLGAVARIRGAPLARPAARLHGLIDRLELQLRCRGEPLFTPVDVASEFGTVPLLDVAVMRRGRRWLPDASGVATLREAGVDVWLCFTTTAPRALLPRVSRLGVWGLEIGLRVPAASSWAGAAEVAAGSTLTLAQVVDYTRGPQHALYRVCGATICNSARRNRLLTLRKAMSFFARLLNAQVRDAAGMDRPRVMAPQLPGDYPSCREPTLRAVMQLAWRLVAQVAGNRWRALGWLDQWRIAYYYADEGSAAQQRPARLHSLVPPRDHDWADPFLVRWRGRDCIFFEELPHRSGKGHISVIEFGADGQPGPPQPVLIRPYHLSYPFVFDWNGELYMLPESAQNSTVELYRCEQFPTRWSLHSVLLDGISAYDATLLQDARCWWLFVTVAEPGATPTEELHLYYSDSPLGPWQAHVANPVISDVRCARGAGPLFTHAGLLYRPSQDCSSTYGRAVSINRVDVLDTGRYVETPVGRIAPDWRADMRCLHTFGAAGRLRVVDYQVRRPRWRIRESETLEDGA